MASTSIQIKAEDGVIRLHAGQLAIIDRPQGVTITCTSGAAWLTQGSAMRDFVLYNRDRLLLDRRSRVIVEALFDCSLRIEASPPVSMWARTTAFVQRWGQRQSQTTTPQVRAS